MDAAGTRYFEPDGVAFCAVGDALQESDMRFLIKGKDTRAALRFHRARKKAEEMDHAGC
jgi:hypothetical protein